MKGNQYWTLTLSIILSVDVALTDHGWHVNVNDFARLLFPATIQRLQRAYNSFWSVVNSCNTFSLPFDVRFRPSPIT
jgi:hypothetical protein